MTRLPGPAAALLVVALAAGESSGQYAYRGAVGAAAGSFSAGDDMLRAMAGQAVTGRAAGGDAGASAGFWRQIEAPAFVSTSAEEQPSAYRLEQNYPNPFNPTTRIRFTLPAPGEVTLDLYDMLGRLVATLATGTHTAGRHEVSFDASGLAAGAYHFRLGAGPFSETRTMLLLK